MEPRRNGGARRARHCRWRGRQPRHRLADDGREPPARRPRGRPAQRERRHRHGPGAARGRRGLRPHQRRQAACDPAARRLVLPPRRQLCDDARRASRRLRARRVPGLGKRRSRQLAHRRGRRDPGGRGRDGPRHRREEDVRDDGAHDQGRRREDRRALQLSADRHRLRDAHLHRPGGDRRRPARAGPRRNGRRDALRRTASQDRRADRARRAREPSHGASGPEGARA